MSVYIAIRGCFHLLHLIYLYVRDSFIISGKVLDAIEKLKSIGVLRGSTSFLSVRGKLNTCVHRGYMHVCVCFVFQID